MRTVAETGPSSRAMMNEESARNQRWRRLVILAVNNDSISVCHRLEQTIQRTCPPVRLASVSFSGLQPRYNYAVRIAPPQCRSVLQRKKEQLESFVQPGDKSLCDDRSMIELSKKSLTEVSPLFSQFKTV